MKIGIVSDSHGRQAAVRLALAELRERGIRTVLHCGDIDDPETVLLFRGLAAHFVFGNCDADRTGLRRAMEQIGATLHENFGHVELEGVTIAFIHGDDAGLLRDLEASGHYDFLFYGHTHAAAQRRKSGGFPCLYATDCRQDGSRWRSLLSWWGYDLGVTTTGW